MHLLPPVARFHAMFLLAAFAGLMGNANGYSTSAAEPSSRVVQLSPRLAVYCGPIHTGILLAGDRALLIDCGDGSVADVLPGLGIRKVETLLFTHHHRDQACGAGRFVEQGAEVIVPEAERTWFGNVEEYWNDRKSRWDVYNFHPHRLMLTESLPVTGTLTPGDRFTWHGASISVLAMPGHTDGSLSYLVEGDGRKTVFCGDAIFDAGKIWELYSLQKGFQRNGRRIGDYHGFLGARDELVESLRRIQQSDADLLVPSHGNMMHQPHAAIDALIDRLDTCYDRYVAISALRHYFPELFGDFEGRAGHMPIHPGKPVPECLLHFGTTWIVVSETKAAFVIDCGNEKRIADLQRLIQEGQIERVEGLWITHYHNDHTAAIPAFQKKFDCPLIADRHVAEVIADPMAWRIPCISPSVARVDRVPQHGESWQWHEFKMTSYHLPGQTLYHGGLLVEGHGVRMFFVGDSFTPAGIDDYCALNRNWLGSGVGFEACLDLIEKLQPTHLLNCHVDAPFVFTPDQLLTMRENLQERERVFGELFPWDHANYGMDESWIRAFPYEQVKAAGEEFRLDVVVTNHSPVRGRAAARLVVPRSWERGTDGGTGRAAEWTEAELPPKSETPLAVKLAIPDGVKSGRYPLAIDVRFGDRTLPEFSEAIVVVP